MPNATAHQGDRLLPRKTYRCPPPTRLTGDGKQQKEIKSRCQYDIKCTHTALLLTVPRSSIVPGGQALFIRIILFQGKAAAPVETMRTYLTFRQAYGFYQVFQRVELQWRRGSGRSAIVSTIRWYSGDPVCAYFSKFLFSSPSNSLISRRVINSISLFDDVKLINGQP